MDIDTERSYVSLSLHPDRNYGQEDGRREALVHPAAHVGLATPAGIRLSALIAPLWTQQNTLPLV